MNFVVKKMAFFFLFFLVACENPEGTYGDLGEQDQSQVDDFYREPLVKRYRERTNDSPDGYEAVQMINDLLDPPGTSEGNCSIGEGRSPGMVYRESTVPEPEEIPAVSSEINSLVPTINHSEEEATEKGFYTYGQSRKRYGTERTKWRLLKAGEKLAEQNLVMGVGNISRAGGGRLPPHMSHQKGVDVDLRLIGPNGKGQRCNLSHPASVRNSCYDREKTFQMVKTLIDVDVRNVDKVLINDPELRSMINSYYEEMSGSNRPIAQACTGHDNHIHMSWKN